MIKTAQGMANERLTVGDGSQSDGGFFATILTQQEMIVGIVGHIRKFWEPHMRRELLTSLPTNLEGREGDVALDMWALHAVVSHHAVLTYVD